MNTPESMLSPQAAQRRDVMREELMDAFATMHRKRRLQRRVAAPAAVLAIALAAAWALRPTHSPSIAPVAAAGPMVEVIEIAATGRAVDFEWVAPRHAPLVAIVESLQSQPPLVQVIDDDQLVQTLAQMDRPAGLIEIGGAVRLTRDVLDEGNRPDDGDSRLDDPHLPWNTQPGRGV